MRIPGALCVLAVLLVACSGIRGRAMAQEITSARAIEIAKAHAKFEVVAADAVRTTESRRRVWRVTLQGRPASPEFPELRPILIVVLDRQTGEVISLAKS